MGPDTSGEGFSTWLRHSVAQPKGSVPPFVSFAVAARCPLLPSLSAEDYDSGKEQTILHVKTVKTSRSVLASSALGIFSPFSVLPVKLSACPNPQSAFPVTPPFPPKNLLRLVMCVNAAFPDRTEATGQTEAVLVRRAWRLLPAQSPLPSACSGAPAECVKAKCGRQKWVPIVDMFWGPQVDVLDHCLAMDISHRPLGYRERETKNKHTTAEQDPKEVPEDLSLEEREELLDIRRRKKELIDDIERLKYEIAEVMTEIDNLTSVEESKTTQRNKQIAMGRKKFNMDPKKGIQFLIENDLLQSSPEDVAQFLYKGEGLNKTVIGDYLGERDEFNIKVLQAFVELHEFADLNLVQALRQFLWSFRLPGEAQKIDRMMEAFASRYCLCNPGVFQSTDTCYVLSFAIIMLNTSLHNHNVRDKPTAERFITMNRGINEGGDLPEELLRHLQRVLLGVRRGQALPSLSNSAPDAFRSQSLYESIKNEPFKIPEDDGNDLTHTLPGSLRTGGWASANVLLDLGQPGRSPGGRVKTWKRRWFILTDNCLYYFEYTTDKEPRGIIPLENLSIREVEDPRKPNCFELYNPSHKGQVIKACKTEADGRVVEGPERSRQSRRGCGGRHLLGVGRACLDCC
ncbi:cytohesin-3 [Camelus ferus]|nr:cytohesin-3 [Camelus ferus]